ncbi:mas-related G-protein coupled receptor member H-like [Malurus melanocephalus]|uniref:mas-related G-protein coupled receptor member H-like n=1 Tax=Malurus melanocephalus TaxID=175006 RepID=UPI00254952E6|nr:mas-related G-protein coupled receptor member H-like [Malurus melanocephalus]
MNMSTVSPLPNSTTERYDPCKLDDAKVTMSLVTLLVCLCGLAGNGVVLCLLGFSSRSKPITVYIFHMAITDSAFLLLIIIGTLLVREIPCFRNMPMKYAALLEQLFLFFYDLGLYLLTAISFNRCRSIFCPLRCHCQRSQHQSMVVSAMQGAISIAVIPTLTSLFLNPESDAFRMISSIMHYISFLFWASSMVMSSISLFCKSKCASQQQQKHKRLDITVFLMVLFALPPYLCISHRLPVNSLYTEIIFLLTCIHCTIKFVIYFSVGSCGRPCSVGSPRLSLQRVLGEPEENTASSTDASTDTVV